MKLNQLTKALAVAFALPGMVQVQAKPEIYVTENNSAPIEYIEAASLQQEGDECKVVERIYPKRKGYRNNKKKLHTTRHIVKESSSVTMGDVTRVIAYTAGVGVLAFAVFGIYALVISLGVASMVG